MPLILATIRATSARAEDWERVLGGHRVPIKSPIPHSVEITGRGRVQAYELALDQLTPTQRVNLVGYLAKRFEMTPAEVLSNLSHNGYVPILAEDVTVSIDARCIL